MIRDFFNKLFSDVPEWDGSERRTSLRATCDCPLEVMLEREPCSATSVDIGSTGLRVRLDKPSGAAIKRGQSATIRHPSPPKDCDVDTIKGSVRWVKADGRGQVVALAFDDPIETLRRSWIKPLMLERFRGASTPRRRHHRVSSRLPAFLRIPDVTEELSTQLHDLSTRGVRLEIPLAVAVGTEVQVRLPAVGAQKAVNLSATVRRCVQIGDGAHQVGLSFAPDHSKKLAILRLFRDAIANQGKPAPRPAEAPKARFNFPKP